MFIVYKLNLNVKLFFKTHGASEKKIEDQENQEPQEACRCLKQDFLGLFFSRDGEPQTIKVLLFYLVDSYTLEST